MYCKRVLILQQTDRRFSMRNRELCGLVKLVNNNQPQTTVTVFVANADDGGYGQWWLLLNFGNVVCVKLLTDLNNKVFAVPAQQQDNVGCLLVKREAKCFEAARASVGNAELCDALARNMDVLVETAAARAATDNAIGFGGAVMLSADGGTPTVPVVQAGATDEARVASARAASATDGQAAATAADAGVAVGGSGDAPTAYEDFVARTADYYVDLDVNNLRNTADERYRSVEAYSEAFDRFYAAGSGTDYYQTVKAEVGKIFVEFPPYFPLINKYAESFFVRIDFPSSEKYFVFGIMQRDKKVRYICYGVPAEKPGFADKDFVYVDNVPTPFWMLFQDADNGQITTLSTAMQV